MLNKVKATLLLLATRAKEAVLSTTTLHLSLGAGICLISQNAGAVLALTGLAVLVHKMYKHVNKED